MKRYYAYVTYFFMGLAIGLSLTLLLHFRHNKSISINIQTYVAYHAAAEFDDIQSIKRGEASHVSNALSEDLLVDWVRLILGRREHVNNQYSDDLYYKLKEYFKQHPDEWNWLPEGNIKMLPGDPILPNELNVRALIESDLKNDK